MPYYPYGFKLDGQVQYLIWFLNQNESEEGSDTVLLDNSGFIISAYSIPTLTGIASGIGIKLKETDNVAIIDLNTLSHWLKYPKKRNVDCKLFLNVWNLFTDIYDAIGEKGSSLTVKCTHKVYDKLFWGNNLPAMTPAGREYIPIWSRAEMNKMRLALKPGLRMFQERLRDQ